MPRLVGQVAEVRGGEAEDETDGLRSPPVHLIGREARGEGGDSATSDIGASLSQGDEIHGSRGSGKGERTMKRMK